VSAGRLYVISGPSGTGKSTVIRRLLEVRPHLVFSVSCTTRPPRPGEVDGRDYRFVSEREFAKLVEDGAFLEWAEVFGHRYGTLLGPIADAVEGDRDVVMEIDVQGAASVRQRDMAAILIFLLPPSMDELTRRLAARRTETGAQRERRLAAAQQEMAQAAWFDHVVVNDDVDRAAREVAAIIDAERSKGGVVPAGA
jgi:guanylate kinase